MPWSCPRAALSTLHSAAQFETCGLHPNPMFGLSPARCLSSQLSLTRPRQQASSLGAAAPRWTSAASHWAWSGREPTCSSLPHAQQTRIRLIRPGAACSSPPRSRYDDDHDQAGVIGFGRQREASFETGRAPFA